MRSTEGLHLCGPRGNDEDPDPVWGVFPMTEEGIGLGYEVGEESEDMPRLGVWAAG